MKSNLPDDHRTHSELTTLMQTVRRALENHERAADNVHRLAAYLHEFSNLDGLTTLLSAARAADGAVPHVYRARSEHARRFLGDQYRAEHRVSREAILLARRYDLAAAELRNAKSAMLRARRSWCP